MTKNKNVFPWRAGGAEGMPLSGRLRMIMGEHQRVGNFFHYRNVPPILDLDPEEVFPGGRLDLDQETWSDFGPLYNHMGPPAGALEALREASSREHVEPYSLDLVEPLRDLTAKRVFQRERGADFGVVGVEGAHAGIGYSCLAFLDPGDEVIITDPGYFYLVPAVQISGAKVVRIPLTSSSGYRLCPDDLARSLTDRTRMLILCDPNNPFGTVQRRDELSAIARITRERGIVVDDITHNNPEIDPQQRQIPLSALGPEEDVNHVLTTWGLSSAYGLAGLRLGVVGGHPAQIRAVLYAKSAVTRISTNRPAQHAAMAALQDDAYHRACEALLRENLARLRSVVASCEGVSLAVEPACGLSATLDVSDTGASGQELMVALFKRRCAVYCADGLGDEGALRYVRLNISNPESRHFERLGEAMADAVAEAASRIYRDAVAAFFRENGTERGMRLADALEGL